MTISFFRSVKSLFVVCFLAVSASYAQTLDIIPYPSKIEIQNGVFNLSESVGIFFHNDCKNEALFLQRVLLEEHHLSVRIAEQQTNPGKGNIFLTTSPDRSNDLGKEGYTIHVDGESVAIKGATSVGVFYGIQSLRQIIRRKDGSKTATIQQSAITDAPHFAWRAFMLDEGRYFKGEKAVKDILDEMALLKMNVFHWHLTDDQGWRIEIKKYPKLTEVGSTRRESEIGTWLSDKFDGKMHGGFYSQEQIKSIIQYASDRYITIIPEIEMPGHASAAIASYPWLSAANEPITVPVVFRIQTNVFNVVNPKVQQFLHDVLDEVMELFPSKIVHIGGDEVRYDQWKASAEVNDYMKQNKIKTPADLQISFTNGISNYLEQHQHRMIGWNEILGGHHALNDSTDAVAQQKLSQTAIIQFWSGNPEIVTEAALKGHHVVNSSAEFTYLDYDYKTTSLEKAYSFNPVPASLSENLHHMILGLGCQMWGEWIPSVEKMNEQIYPRIAAYAETGWTKTGNKNFNRFNASLSSYLKTHWKNKGIVLLPEFR